MNASSSRSHLVMTIRLNSTNKITDVETVGKLTLVDLAGSERQSKTGSSGDTLKEAQSINTSLSALGNVISAITAKKKHIPYRDSQLTQLLSDSLGGNAKTLMFVNVSPADYNVAETCSSLQFASRVRKVTNKSTKQIENKQIKMLKQKLRQLQQQKYSRHGRAWRAYFLSHAYAAGYCKVEARRSLSCKRRKGYKSTNVMLRYLFL